MTLLNFDGCLVVIECDNPSVERAIRHDFHCFLTATAQREPDLRLRVSTREQNQPRWTSWLRTKRAVWYLAPPGTKRLRYFDDSYLEYSFRSGTAAIKGGHWQQVYEVCYYVLHSFVGEWWDLRGRHRCHGFGFSFHSAGAIALASSGEGKSTLAWHLLPYNGVRFFSDDIPWVDKSGKIYPFPLRVALSDKPHVGSPYVRPFERVGHKTKWVVSSRYFENKVDTGTPLKTLFALKRTDFQKSERPGFQSMSRWRLGAYLLKWLVLGYETPQIWELYLRLSPVDWFRKAAILWSRLQTAFVLVRKCEAKILVTARTPEETASKLRLGLLSEVPA